MKFYSVRGPDLWGDYGDILVTGMTGHLGRKDSLLQLERTGPFVPPITFPSSDLLVTARFRQCLEESKMGQYRFRRVNMTRIVEYAWHEWDRKSDEPEEYPDGEPGDYILQRPHSEPLAASLEDIWELVPYDVATIEISPEIPEWLEHYVIDDSTWNGDHLFFGQLPGGQKPFVTDVGRQFLMDQVPEWVTFNPVLLAPVPPKEFYLRDRLGKIEAEPTVDRMRQVLGDLDQGGIRVGLAHRSNWSLVVYASRRVVWCCLGDYYSDPCTMDNVSDNKIIKLWTYLSWGNIDEVEKQDWTRNGGGYL